MQKNYHGHKIKVIGYCSDNLNYNLRIYLFNYIEVAFLQALVRIYFLNIELAFLQADFIFVRINLL